MAQRIDSGVQPTAHSAVQAMIVRAQLAADQTGATVGVHYDLGTDELSVVEIGPDTPADTIFVRIATPVDGSVIDGADEPADDGETPEIKAASV